MPADTDDLDDLPMKPMHMAGTEDRGRHFIIPWKLAGCSAACIIGAIVWFSRGSRSEASAALVAGYSLELQLHAHFDDDDDAADDYGGDYGAPGGALKTRDQDASRHRHSNERNFLFGQFIKE